MWRRVIYHVGKVLRIDYPAAAAPSNVSVMQSNKFDEAHIKLREAVRELSNGSSTAISVPSDNILKEWKSKDISLLSDDQLTELARAYFEGVPDLIDVDHIKAVKLWKFAASRGNVDASYSLAVCLRDGKGITADSTAAIKILQDLCENHNYNMAHVRNFMYDLSYTDSCYSVTYQSINSCHSLRWQ